MQILSLLLEDESRTNKDSSCKCKINLDKPAGIIY